MPIKEEVLNVFRQMVEEEGDNQAKAAAKLVSEESVTSCTNCPNALVPILIRNASNNIKRFMFIEFRNL